MKTPYLSIIVILIFSTSLYLKPIQAESSDPIQILNVQVQPNIIKVNNTFSLDMVILNNSPFPIYLTSGSCTPAFSVVFDAHVKQVYPNIFCTSEAILQKVEPLSEATISNANKPGVLYQAVQPGTATANITLSYFAKNQTATDYSNIYYNTSKSFLFSISDNSTNLTVQNYGQKPIVHMIQSPLKQFDSGVAANDIACTNDLTLVIKAEDSLPACVTPDTASILIERGWAINMSQTNHMTNAKTSDPFGITALVIYKPALACLSPLSNTTMSSCPPNNFYLKINSNSTAYLLGYNICDDNSCAENNNLSFLLPLNTVANPNYQSIDLPVDLQWKYGDTVNIQLRVSSDADNKHASLIDLGNSIIVP